ncbi:Clp protease N-terminal domain-containing protein [Kitasatospora paracochleata]|uniref:ATP-dependent Clp protease ATP-binding subunit ClpA n=1 Tax=Kitasatospora paracochleata TaxID=58354 RepID=A0ABT1IRU1_9ACTN|nr:Clp protease N-terminal domain-containing protein [Kitasatospora paracochleata]MCP2307851.1 ATP-dependent Clp protease ATP-binding subunit ClpA [Kitasatospora paracochleata]
MFERFADGARRVVVAAGAEAERLRHSHIGTEHLLLGVLDQPQDPAAAVLVGAGLDAESGRRAVVRLLGGPGDELDGAALAAIGVDLGAIREAVEATFGPGALDAPPSDGRRQRWGGPRFTDRARKVLVLSLRAATGRGERRIEIGHLLLGLLREGNGLAVRVIREHGLDPADVERQVEAALARAA